jgi:hypothetical protein
MRYIAAPANSTMLYPADKASMTARIGASTKKQPFTAQAQGMSRGGQPCAAAEPGVIRFHGGGGAEVWYELTVLHARFFSAC